MRIALVCGHKYGFRGVYLPLIQQLHFADDVQAFVMDYPSGYDFWEAVLELNGSAAGRVRTILIPDSRHRIRHHRALAANCRDLKANPLDALVVDGGSMPMHKYFVRIAKRHHAPVIVVLKEAPLQLLEAYYRDKGRVAGETASRVQAKARLSRNVQRLVHLNGIAELAKFAAFRIRSKWVEFAEYRLLPWLLTGRGFEPDRFRQRDLRYASHDVNWAIVHNEEIKQALTHFFPKLSVVVADHPSAAACRCGPARIKTKLLVVFGGPWEHYIRPDNPAEAIIERWSSAIRRAVREGCFREVDIRQHPRERGQYAERVAGTLADLDATVQVIDPTAKSLREIVCDYRALLGAPSGALVEALGTCRQLSVVGIDRIEGTDYNAQVEAYSRSLVSVSTPQDLNANHFVPPPVRTGTGLHVGDVIRDIVERSGRANRG